MSEQVPSKELNERVSAEHAHAPVQYGWLHIPDTARGTDTPAWVRLGDYLKLQNAHKVLLAENERLRKQVAELSIHAEKWVKRALTPAHEREMPHCSTCSCPPYQAPEPGEVATDAERWRTYLKCYDREEMVASEWDGPAAITAFIDSQRTSQPPEGGQQ